jgi:hypothetical protein
MSKIFDGASLLEGVNVAESGDRIVMSSDDGDLLVRVMGVIEGEGAVDVKHPVRIGQRWIASFRNPKMQACVIDRMGFLIVVTGPTEKDVTDAVAELSELGAIITSGPELRDGVWVTTLDDAAGRLRG